MRAALAKETGETAQKRLAANTFRNTVAKRNKTKEHQARLS